MCLCFSFFSLIKLNSLTRKNIPLICVAAAAGSLDVVKFLVKAGAQVDVTEDDGISAVHWAALSGHHRVLNFLIEILGSKVLQSKQNPLILATRYGRTECVKILLGAACWFGHTDIVKLFLKNDVNVNQPDNSGKTPLHCCCWFGNRESEVELIKKNASVNVKDKSDDTPLHLACMHNYVDIVSDLIDAGADPKIKNQLGKTPEEVAEAENHDKIIELFQKKGKADKKKADISDLDKNIIYEQRKLASILDDLLMQQEKQSYLIKQLKIKIATQSNTLSKTRAQQISLQIKVSEISEAALQIASKVDALLPRSSTLDRYSFTRVPTT